MAMTKAEMEDHQHRYQSLLSEAQAADRAGFYCTVIEKAKASWKYIDGMMQYERRYENKEFGSIPTIDLALKYAPLLLDYISLNTLEELLKDCRRIENNTSESLGDKLSAARALMRDAHCLWDHLEHNPGFRQDELRRVIGGEPEQWRAIVEGWEKMALLRREPEGGTYRLALATRMDEVIPAKCPACGIIAEVPKAMCLDKTVCPECKNTVLFVILSKRPKAGAKE
jgi:hypothetical protein